MRDYTPLNLARFLREIDRHLVKQQTIIVIGGAAAALAYQASQTTSDIDTATALDEDFLQAAELARQTTGLEIPVSYAAIADGPYGYESRLVERQDLRLNQLVVLFPEEHDLALMKIIRGEEHDLQAISEIHGRHRLSLDVLCDRFVNELGHVVGNKTMIRLNFLALVQSLFGHEAAKVTERRTAGWGQPGANP